tara:strand:- start:39378 stop:42833 length:3456 start_codon:yes stop_codon:yes gene_type:complete
MRFSSSTRPASLARGCRDCIATWGTGPRIAWIIIASIGCIASANQAFSQGPGTKPPADIFESSDGDSSGNGLQMKGFLLLDESGVEVLVPQMTYERWHELESGVDGPQQAYVFRSLEVDGVAENGRAELEVTLRFSVDISDGRSVPIPLRMGNFHCLSPPDVSGVDDHSMTVAPDNGGYVLWVRADKPREATLRMKVAARVDDGTMNALQFRLPNVPSSVQLTVAGENLSTGIVGRGDEVLQTKKSTGGKSQLVVESGGGTFMLRWGGQRRQDDTTPQLEVDSDIDVRWISPEDQPTASVTLTVRNLRGPVSQFDVIFPAGSVLLDSPILESSGRYLDVATLPSTDQTLPLRFTIPEEEQKQRIDLKLELQLANRDASASTPLSLQLPDVIGAIRQRGEVHIRIGNDYRLRWLSRQWIQSVVNANVEDTTSNRRYSFRYDRGGLSLPIYLAAKQRQVRLVSNASIVLSDSLAMLDLTVNASGQAFDGRGLNMDMKGWQLRSVEDIETGEELEYFKTDEYHEIEMNSGGADESAPVRIVAERDLKSGETELSLPLPSIVKVDENQVVQTSTVVVRSIGRSAFVIDMPKSTGLDRLGDTPDFGPIEPNIHRFQVLPADAAAVIVGNMVPQTPRIDLACTASIQLDAGEMRTMVDWTMTSLFDLEGRLPIDLPDVPRRGTNSSSLTDAVESEVDHDLASDWMVTVNDSAAVLRHIEGSRYDLVSDRLADGTVSIRWWNSRAVLDQSASESLHWAVLPRPTVADVSMQNATRVTLIGNQQAELLGAGGRTEFMFESLPRDPIRVRMVPRSELLRNLSVRRAVLRTAIGRNVRYEQLIASVKGGETMDVSLVPGTGDVKVEAFVDQEPAAVRRDNNVLRIALPIDNESHTVDLQLWFQQTPAGWFDQVKPSISVPVGVGRAYWQIVVPSDAHVVWSAPTLGRAMNWQLDGWRLARLPIRDDQELTDWVGISQTRSMPSGNRYLYFGTDSSGFIATTSTRGQLWAMVAAIVLAIAALLSYVPRTRHPLTAVVAAVALSGLIAVAPDAAVLAGQLAMVALVLVVVMMSIRVMMVPRQSNRVFRHGRGVDPSTRTIKPVSRRRESHVSMTETIQSPMSDSASRVRQTDRSAAERTAGVAAESAPSDGSGRIPPTTEVRS